MDHLITTPFGKVLGRIKSNQIEIFDTATLRPLARVEGDTREVMLTAIRRLVTLTRLSLAMGNMRMTLLGSFENPVESTAPKKTRKKRTKKTVEVSEQPATIKEEDVVIVQSTAEGKSLDQVVQELSSKANGKPVSQARSPKVA